MGKYVKTRTVRELTDDAKIAQVQKLIVEQEDATNRNNLETLISKYGPYAYDIIKVAQSEDAEISLKHINITDKKTPEEIIAHFAQNDISSADLATLLKKREMEIDSGIANYKIATMQDVAPAVDLSEQQQKLEQRVDDREPTGHVIDVQKREGETINQPTEPVATAEEAAPTPTPQAEEKKEDTPSTEQIVEMAQLPQMTLDDYVKYYKPEDKPLTEKELQEVAYKDFAKGEGRSQRIYVEQPNKGNPTIGTGNLIFPEQLLDPNVKNKEKYGSLPAYKERFQQMKLYKNVGGKEVPLTAQEKGKIFDDLVTAAKNNTLKTKNINDCYVIVSPASAAKVIMREADMKTQFNKDFNAQMEKMYKGIGKGNKEKGKEIFSKYPKDLQLSLMHAYYAGTPGANISKAIAKGEVNPENPVEVLTQIAKERTVGDDEALAMLQKLNPEEFSDQKIAQYKQKYQKNRKNPRSTNAPRVDARQMGEAADSLSQATEARRMAELEIRMKQQKAVKISPDKPKIENKIPSFVIAANKGMNGHG